MNRHFVDEKLRRGLAERTKALRQERRTAKPGELEKRQAAIMRDQMTLNVQSLKSMCAMSLITVPMYSWATTYVLKSPAWIIGWVALSVVLGIVLKTTTDKIWKR